MRGILKPIKRLAIIGVFVSIGVAAIGLAVFGVFPAISDTGYADNPLDSVGSEGAAPSTPTPEPVPDEPYTPTPESDNFEDVPEVSVGIDQSWDRDTHPDDPGRSAYTTERGRIDSLAVEYHIHDEVNEHRTARGLPPMEASWYVGSTSRAHSADMARRGYMSHTSPDGAEPVDRFGKFPEHCSSGYGENIAQTWADTPVETGSGAESYRTAAELAASVVAQWMNSEGHRENILNERWEYVGTGVYIDDRGDRAEVFATQNFCVGE